MANIVVTYFLWLFGGLWGLHHFYLGRDRHAFVWWVSLGGLFVGWFRDLWRLPEYVFAANNDPRYVAEFAERTRRHTKPRFCVVRFAGKLMIGSLFGYLMRLAIAEGVIRETGLYGLFLSLYMPVVGTSIGVWMVSNIGNQKVAMKPVLIGACLGLPWLFREDQAIFMCPLLSSVYTLNKIEWRTDPFQSKTGCRKVMKRLSLLSVLGLLYLSLWSSMIFFNVRVRTRDGVEVPVREAVNNFFKSPAWAETKKTAYALYDYCQDNGWGNCWQQLIEQLDPTGESHAYKVLGFEGIRPSQEEIQSRCRQLRRQWHPDKYRSSEEKAEAQNKFIEIQEACDILDEVKKKRAERSSESVSPEPSSTTTPPREDL